MKYLETRIDQFVGANGETRKIHIWESGHPKAILLGLHGGMAHAGDYVTPAVYLKPLGYTTVAHDMRGHVGKRRVVDIDSFAGLLDDVDIFVGWTRQAYPNLPIVLLSHSMGALVAAHYILKRYPHRSEISGCIMSSPYFANAIKVPLLIRSFARLLSKTVPRMRLPIDDMTDVLTHDPQITQRHIDDQESGMRAREPSIRFACELMQAQAYVQENFKRWDLPLFLVVAGDDRLADSEATLELVGKVDANCVERHVYAENFHENFNETNRNEIFDLLVTWLDKRRSMWANA